LKLRAAEQRESRDWLCHYGKIVSAAKLAACPALQTRILGLPPHGVETVQGKEPERLTLDKAGYLAVYPDPRRNRLTLARQMSMSGITREKLHAFDL
jgi:hypothetical protein